MNDNVPLPSDSIGVVDTSATEIIPGKPCVYGIIDRNMKTKSYKMVATTNGHYRVWSSFMTGTASIINLDGRVIASGLQQVETNLEAGEYVVELSALDTGQLSHFRIVARKVSEYK